MTAPVPAHGTLIVPARVAARIDADAHEISYTLLGHAPSPAGGVWRLSTAAGRALGLAFDDPDDQRLLMMSRADEPWTALGDPWLRARVSAAWTLRQALGLGAPDGAHRLLHGAGDGLPGLAIDRYGAWAVVSAASRGVWPMAMQAAHATVAVCGLRGAVVKLRTRGAAAHGAVTQEVVGEAPPERLVVSEGPRRIEVHLASGMNTGLFADLREQRNGLARYAAGRDVLNLFAYTGALSVAAACGGARTVTSVDLSSGVLAWAADNARLNGLVPDAPGWMSAAQDVRAFLDEAQRDGRRYGLTLIDPPGFSAAREAGFAIERDYPDVIARAARVLAPDGVLWLATNTAGVSLPGLAQAGLQAAGRRGRVLETAGLPPDFPTRLSDVGARYLQVLVLAVDSAAD